MKFSEVLTSIWPTWNFPIQILCLVTRITHSLSVFEKHTLGCNFFNYFIVQLDADTPKINPPVKGATMLFLTLAKKLVLPTLKIWDWKEIQAVVTGTISFHQAQWLYSAVYDNWKSCIMFIQNNRYYLGMIGFGVTLFCCHTSTDHVACNGTFWEKKTLSLFQLFYTKVRCRYS